MPPLCPLGGGSGGSATWRPAARACAVLPLVAFLIASACCQWFTADNLARRETARGPLERPTIASSVCLLGVKKAAWRTQVRYTCTAHSSSCSTGYTCGLGGGAFADLQMSRVPALRACCHLIGHRTGWQVGARVASRTPAGRLGVLHRACPGTASGPPASPPRSEERTAVSHLPSPTCPPADLGAGWGLSWI